MVVANFLHSSIVNLAISSPLLDDLPLLSPINERGKTPDITGQNTILGKRQSAEMSIASSIPCMKIKTYHSSKTFSLKSTFNVRSSKGEGPLRRPAVPSLTPPPTTSIPSLSPPLSLSPVPPAKPAVPDEGQIDGQVTLEYQRRIAKELQEYFRQKKMEEADQGPPFGFVGKNEISNGRWAMFGFSVGLLTEYATGSDLVQQLKILLSNFGVVDLD